MSQNLVLHFWKIYLSDLLLQVVNAFNYLKMVKRIIYKYTRKVLKWMKPVLFEWLIWLLCMTHDPSLRNVQRSGSTLHNTSLVNSQISNIDA